MPFSNFDVDFVSLRRAEFLGRYFFTLSVEDEAEPPLDVHFLRQMADELSDHLLESEHHNPVRAEGWIGIPEGFAAVLVHAQNWDDVLGWFDAFTQLFGGANGKIRGGPRERHPKNVSRYDRWELGSFCAYTTRDLSSLDPDQRSQAWGVEEDVTRNLAQKSADWAVLPYATAYLSYGGTTTPTIDTDLGLPLAEARLRGEIVCSVDQELRKENRMRRAVFTPGGAAGYQVWDEEMEWRPKHEDLIRTIAWAPERLDLAFIRYCRHPFWDGPFSPDWPHIREADYRYNRPLLAHFVPDVNGTQLLTNAHLERASDLTGWDVQDLPGGRHLVTTRELDAWYATPEPPAELLAQGRADFGEMIMTPETIERHSPWRN